MPTSLAISSYSKLPHVSYSDTLPAMASRSVETPATQANLRSQMNAAIVKASFEISISSKNDPLALLLKT